jgi:hypothetical protein
VNRLIKRYKPGDNACFRHGNTHKIPHNKTNSEVVKRIIELKKSKYKLFSITHFCEKLNDCENIKIKLVTLKRIFRANRIITRFTRKSTIKIYENELKQLEIPNKAENIVEKVYQDLILCKDKQHCRISVEPLFGNIVEVDASEFIFFGNKVVHLHLFVDRATNKILAGYFDSQETLNGYRHAFMTLLTKYGAPMKLVSDYRGVFSVLRNKNDPESAKLTQFSY